VSKEAKLIAFKRRVAAWAEKLKCHPKQVVVMRMRKKWASCSTSGRVCFARDVLKLSKALQDYIVVHELLHLRHPNHRRIFKSLLLAHLPEAHAAARRLRRRSVTGSNTHAAFGS